MGAAKKIELQFPPGEAQAVQLLLKTVKKAIETPSEIADKGVADVRWDPVGVLLAGVLSCV